jgi:hypothetical protein
VTDRQLTDDRRAIVLANDLANTVGDMRVSANGDGYFDGYKYPRQRLFALERAGLVVYEGDGLWRLTERGRLAPIEREG